MKNKMLNIIFQRINIVIFFIVIFSPCLVMICGQKTVFSYTEKRLLAAFPSIQMNVYEVRRFFSDVDNYLNDHFGFREWMVYRYQREIRKRFADVGTLTKVMKGTDDWYFFTGDSQLEDYTGRDLLSKSDLKKWLETYRAKQQWLQKQGIRYLFIVPPNKMTVYGEFLGEPWLSQKGKTRLSQIKNALEESDHAEGRRDDAAKAEIQQRPGRVLAGRAAAEIVAGDEDLRFRVGVVVQHEVRQALAGLVIAQLGEEALAKPGAGDGLQILLGDDHVSVDIDHRQMGGDTRKRREFFHGLPLFTRHIAALAPAFHRHDTALFSGQAAD